MKRSGNQEPRNKTEVGTMDQQKIERNLPERKFRAGAVAATVWKNHGSDKQGKATEYRTVSFERSYMDKDGKWKNTSSLRLNDLPRASVVLNKAYEYLVLKDNSDASEELVS